MEQRFVMTETSVDFFYNSSHNMNPMILLLNIIIFLQELMKQSEQNPYYEKVCVETEYRFRGHAQKRVF